MVQPGYTVAGVWVGGEQTGRGVWHSPGQSLKYVGGFKAGAFHGEGQLYGTIPGRFSSVFESRPAKLHGRFEMNEFVEGTITFENGDTYKGTFRFIRGDICCTGMGTYTEANGDGVGMYFDADGTFDGYWVE